jgi:RNA polymerase sigma factor (sigma-70 family)
MRRHNIALVRFLSRQVGGQDDADDIAQNTFVAIHRNLHRFDPKRSFLTWMYFIARNKAKDHFRRRAVLRWVGLEEGFDQMPSLEAGPATQTEDRDELRRAEAVIQDMPEGLKTPLMLSATDGLSLAAIGEIMGISTKAAEVRVYRARKMLKEKFSAEG